jgi:1-acyl-sn-glycerol-3-phosphate acyltransferase
MPPWLMDRWWDLGKTTCFYAMTALFRLRTTGTHHIPRSGPVLVLSNHQSFLDPIHVGLPIPRYVRFVHRQSLKKNRLLAWVMASLRAIPIEHRGFSREGLQATLDSLAAGNCVGMFPEGERTHDGTVQPFKPGIALLLKRVKAPIVPVGIAGAYAAFSRHRKLPRLSPIVVPPTDAAIAVSVGAPIDPTRYANASREEMLDDLRAAVVAEVARAEDLRRKAAASPPSPLRGGGSMDAGAGRGWDVGLRETSPP